MVGVVLIAGVAVMRPGGNRADSDRPAGDSRSASSSPADDMLRTSGCATYPVAGPTRVGGTPVSGNSDLVNELNNRIFPYATANFADVFAVTEITDIGRLRVYRKPSAEFDTWIMRNFAQDCVEIADAKASAAEMSQKSREIEDDSAYWIGRGIRIQAIGGSPVNGVIEVSVPKEVLVLARQEIPQRYPHLRVAVLAT